MRKSNKDYEMSMSDWAIGLLLIFILAIIPSIVRVASLEVSEIELSTIRNSATVSDVFSYYKSIAICICTGLMVFMLALDIVTETKPARFNFKSTHFILIAVYMLMAVVSSIFSRYGYIAVHGITERYESIWILLCYSILMLLTAYVIKNKQMLYFVIFGVFLSAFIVGGIGFFQFFDLDLFKTEFGKKLVLGKHYSPDSNMRIVFEDVYATLYNPNCVGLYSSMLLPFFLTFAVIMPIKSILKYVSAAFALLMLINLIGSDSAGGLIGFSASLAVLIIVGVAACITKKGYKSISKSSILTVIIAIVVLLAFFALNSSVKTKFFQVASAIFNPPESSIYIFKDLKIDGNKAMLTTANGDLTIEYDSAGSTVNLYGFDGSMLEPESAVKVKDTDNGFMYIYNIDGVGKECRLQLTDESVAFSNGETTFLFAPDGNNLTALTKQNEPVDINEPIPSIGFKGHELLGSARGYIWSKSIPVALRHIILGSGPDSFALEFPQHDLVGKTKNLGNPYIIVDKPHNIYLQAAINTGVISLIALLFLFAYYIFQTIKLILFENSSLLVFTVRIGLLGAVIGYLFSGLSTDSVVSVAPIFWILLGTGFAVNQTKLNDF